MDNSITNISSETSPISTDITPSSYKTGGDIYVGMNDVFAHTRRIIADMQQGEKIGMQDLSEKVASNIKTLSYNSVHNLVQLFCKQSKEVTVEVGRNGGVYEGGKKQRIDHRERCITCKQVIKPSNKSVSSDTDSIPTSSSEASDEEQELQS